LCHLNFNERERHVGGYAEASGKYNPGVQIVMSGSPDCYLHCCSSDVADTDPPAALPLHSQLLRNTISFFGDLEGEAGTSTGLPGDRLLRPIVFTSTKISDRPETRNNPAG
jgi:hypothetical protein